MTLAPGTRLGPYEIVAPLGEGGMGEVYRANDTRLDRIVALKILPEAFASDADRVMRFTREAKALAALNHPNIAQVYDAGREGAQAFIAMEFVDGEDLSVRIQRGPISVAEVLRTARQVADALAAAHDAGIIHRDLKPANVRVTEDGVVKVLDFGLARAGAGDEASSSSDAAATMTSPAMTAIGLVLGTASYMAPEQARGRPVDRRADVWAFGVVLYEMLTGARLFGRDDITDTIAAVVTHDPDLSKLPAGTPTSIGRLIERCLIKDKKLRLDSMTVARIEIDEAMGGKAGPATATAPAPRRMNPFVLASVAIAGVVAGIAGTAAYLSRQVAPATTSPGLMAEIAAPREAIAAFHNGFALSPDGATLAFAARNRSGLQRIWLRRLDAESAHEVAGTDGGDHPFWSPDGRSFAFFAGGKLKRVDADGSRLQIICEAPGHFFLGSWSVKDEILWSSSFVGPHTYKVAASGGTVTTFDGLKSAADPHWLSNGERFLFVGRSADNKVEVQLATADGRLIGTVLEPPKDFGGYSYAEGFLLLNRSGALTAQRFDEKSGTLVGQAATIAPEVGTPKTWFAVSSTSDRLVAMVLRPTPDDPKATGGLARLVWVDREGNASGTLGEPAAYWELRLAPDGKSALVTVFGDFSLLRSDRLPQRVTADGLDEVNVFPVWSRDSSEIIYLRSNGTIFRRPVASQAKPTVVENARGRPEDWSSDGRWLLLDGYAPNSTTEDVMLYDMSSKTERPWLATEFSERMARFSPDGKWVAYASDVSGREEIYVRAFEGEGQPIAVSTGGGAHPFWRQDGNELFYIGPADEVMSVAITRSPATIVPAKPKQLFRIPVNDVTREVFPPYAVTPDGQRFLLNVPDRLAPLFVLQGLGSIVK